MKCPTCGEEREDWLGIWTCEYCDAKIMTVPGENGPVTALFDYPGASKTTMYNMTYKSMKARDAKE